MPFMSHLLKENLGMVFKRSRYIKTKRFHHAFMISTPVDLNFFGDGTFVFPLYLYPPEAKVRLVVEEESKSESTPNFSDEFLQAVKEALCTEPTAEESFFYIYAVLYSPTYRKRYEEFLKIDFPRVPLPSDYESFKNLSELGKELVELHLLKDSSLQKSDREIGFPESGSNVVEKVRFDEENERVYFNKEQYFEGIAKEVWEYRIGAYQVLAKYLKDRKGRELSLEEIEHYMEVAKAIERTIEVQKEIEDILGLKTLEY